MWACVFVYVNQMRFSSDISLTQKTPVKHLVSVRRGELMMHYPEDHCLVGEREPCK